MYLSMGAVSGNTRGADIPWQGKALRVRLVEVAPDRYLFEKVAPFFLAMQTAAKKAGVPWRINTAYRSMRKQDALCREYQAEKAAGLSPTPVARPGTSDHERGIAVDIDTQGKGHDSPTYQWLHLWAGGYGFINDVPSEAWHWAHKYQFSPADRVDDPVPEDEEYPGLETFKEGALGTGIKLGVAGALGYALYRYRKQR